jgi:ParB family chromosome partitioning protein
LIDHLKKADMAKEAERLLDGSGWLPEPLRRRRCDIDEAEQEGEAGALPELLSDDEERDVAADDDRPQCQAAE